MRRLRIAKRRVALARRGRRACRELVARTADGGAQPLCRGGDRRGGRAICCAPPRPSGSIAPSDPEDPERGSGLIVLAMGKLGGGELNYSSDIDLILLYDPSGAPGLAHDECPIAVQPACPRSGAHSRRAHRRWLCFSHRPAAAPRPALDAAGDVGRSGADLLRKRRAELGARRHDQGPPGGRRPPRGAALSRRSCSPLSGASISISRRSRTSIRSSARSRRTRAAARIAVEGHDIKLGRGGIREIEFFAQTQQLIWGGRLRELRVRADLHGAAPARRRRPHRRGEPPTR